MKCVVIVINESVHHKLSSLCMLHVCVCKLLVFLSDSLSLDFSPTCEEKASLFLGIQKHLVLSQGDGMASALCVDGDSDSLTTSPSSSSLDTYSGHKQFKPFNSSQGLSYPPTGPSLDTSVMDAGSRSSFSEAEGCCEEDPRITRSVTDGEMRRALGPSKLHGVCKETLILCLLLSPEKMTTIRSISINRSGKPPTV